MIEGVSIGDLGTASTHLRPSGSATIRGAAHSVRADSGFIEAGCLIVVVRADQFGLIVQPAEAVPRHRLPDVGAALPSLEQTRLLREQQEEQVRRDHEREERAKSRRDTLILAFIFGLPGSLVGYWVGDGHGAAVGGLSTIGFIVLVRFAAQFVS